jgi:hypothetical protein
MSTKKLSEAAIMARRAARKAWNDANKERNAEYMRRYWEKKARELIEKGEIADDESRGKR